MFLGEFNSTRELAAKINVKLKVLKKFLEEGKNFIKTKKSKFEILLQPKPKRKTIEDWINQKIKVEIND